MRERGRTSPSAPLFAKISGPLRQGQPESRKERYMSHCGEGSDLRILNAVLNVHVLEFTGLEDLAAFFALHEFRFLVAAHNLHTWVLAGLLCAYVRRRDRRLCGHVIRIVPKVYFVQGQYCAGIFGYCRTARCLVKPSSASLLRI